MAVACFLTGYGAARNLRYVMERFGALIAPMYQYSIKYEEAVEDALNEELKKRVEALAEIVDSLGKAALNDGEKFDVSLEWRKLKALEIPYAAFTNSMMPETENTTECTLAMEGAGKLKEILTSLVNASEEEAQNVWSSTSVEWKK